MSIRVATADREQALNRAFVGLADTLVGDFDVVDLLHSLVGHVTELLGADAAGLLLTDLRGNLQLMASSTEATRLLELFQIQSDEGPCRDCFHTGKPVLIADLDSCSERWPRFVPAARDAGYAAVHALPMRLRVEVIGALNLFTIRKGNLSRADLELAQALADVATIGILQERAAGHREVVIEQTQAVLHRRVVVEQAKGMLFALGVAMEDAFQLLRQFAHDSGRGLVEVAEDLASGNLSPAAVLAIRQPQQGQGGSKAGE